MCQLIHSPSSFEMVGIDVIKVVTKTYAYFLKQIAYFLYTKMNGFQLSLTLVQGYLSQNLDPWLVPTFFIQEKGFDLHMGQGTVEHTQE